MIPRDRAAVMGALMVPTSDCLGPETNQGSTVLHREDRALLQAPELMGCSSKGH